MPLKYIVGYSCYNECTVREWQQHTRQFGMGENFERTEVLDPYMILAGKHSRLHKIINSNSFKWNSYAKCKIEPINF